LWPHRPRYEGKLKKLSNYLSKRYSLFLIIPSSGGEEGFGTITIPNVSINPVADSDKGGGGRDSGYTGLHAEGNVKRETGPLPEDLGLKNCSKKGMIGGRGEKV